MSTVVCKWRQVAHCKLLQLYVKQKKNPAVNKRVGVIKVLAENQQMALVVCHNVIIASSVLKKVQFLFGNSYYFFTERRMCFLGRRS